MNNQKKFSLFSANPARLAQLRIVSGLILFFYVAGHFLNHSLGLWSLSAMETASVYFRQFWRFLPITIILYGALLAHMVLVLVQLFKRQTFSMSAREWLQLALGFSIPLLMVLHLLATRMASELYGLNDNYTYVILATFVQNPTSGFINVAGLLIVWVHGCIGMYSWLRLKPWYRGNWPAVMLVLAALLPVLAINGFVAAGREIALLAQDGEWLGEFYENLNLTNPELGNIVTGTALVFRYAFVALLVSILGIRLVRQYKNRRNNQVSIDYLEGPNIRHPGGANLLEISRIHGVPMASVCGGRGRCSTCRVRLIANDQRQLPPDAGESAVLERVKAPADVRLACQFIPAGEIRVVRLLPADATMRDLGNLTSQSSGVEKVVVILFADIREFTARSETKLPFDVVYLVNQFSDAMGRAIEDAGGKVDKFLGDGVMALFGVDTSPQDGCRAALIAAKNMQLALDELNARLVDDLDEPLRIGIGIHAGPVVLGEMGYGASRSLTAIGDTVNTASRLESATKEHGVSVCISATVANFAGVKFSKKTEKQISLKGKKNTIPIHALVISDLHLDTDAGKTEAAV